MGAIIAIARSKLPTASIVTQQLLFVVYRDSAESYTLENSRRISWGRRLFLTLGAQNRSLIKSINKKKKKTSGKSSSIYCIASYNKTASGLAQEKTPNLIITYTGTLIESVCYYNRARWKGLGEEKPRLSSLKARLCCTFSELPHNSVSAVPSVWTPMDVSHSWPDAHTRKLHSLLLWADQTMFLTINRRIKLPVLSMTWFLSFVRKLWIIIRTEHRKEKPKHLVCCALLSLLQLIVRKIQFELES